MNNQKPSHDADLDNAGGVYALFDKIGYRFIERPAWFTGVVIIALIALPVAVWLDMRHLSNESLSRQAGDFNAMVSEIRGYYSSNVVGRVQLNKGKATPSHNYRNINGGIPVPATLSIELGEVIGHRVDSYGYRFISNEPFAGRDSHNLDPFELRALKKFREPGNTEKTVTELDGSIFDRYIRMAVPVIMGKACVACHNSHPDSPRKDWKTGDVRGIQSVTIAQPIAANLFSFKFLLNYLLLAGLFGVLFVVLQWRQAKRFALMNSDLEEVNSFLAGISMKISKYLSPQVYKSIFSGERDAVIATERKKLTIFFSDIKDFTATTESLQPEELTALLNEYFTEMAKIAHDHGATLDKFIGDAILAFFGDPDTLGTIEDARACVKMAIAMQIRLEELREEWRRRGFEKPFQARMGINTGYCNVGNFGSDDRMDYTLIGAEANLAARLESIAEPGGIVLSFETFSLVRDDVKAQPMAPIKLKGISRKIIPYAVEDILGEKVGSEIGIIEAHSDRLKLYLDLDAIDANEQKEIEKALQSALSSVQALAK
jgi:adenylate cyclase